MSAAYVGLFLSLSGATVGQKEEEEEEEEAWVESSTWIQCMG
jgi:hypothetical protein